MTSFATTGAGSTKQNGQPVLTECSVKLSHNLHTQLKTIERSTKLEILIIGPGDKKGDPGIHPLSVPKMKFSFIGEFLCSRYYFLLLSKVNNVAIK